MAPIKNSVVMHLRKDMYSKLLQMPIGYFTEQRKGDIMSRMTHDLNEIETSTVGTLEGIIKDPINILVLLLVLVYISPQLSLFLLVLLPITGIIIGRISRSLKKQSGTLAEKSGQALSIIDETLGGLRVIKAFNAENMLKSKFLNLNHDLYILRNKIQFRRDLASPMSEFLGVLVLCAILWFGGKLVLDGMAGNLTPEGFTLYIVLFTQIINPSKTLSTSFYNMQKGAAAYSRVEEILKAPIQVDANEQGMLMESFEHSIEFKNVQFKYQDKLILKDINLKIEKGKTIALVGSSGAGKSTLADLVPRFHDVTSGEILIDGKDIRSYNLNSVRKHISIVTQEPILFNDSIEANICLGMESAKTESIQHAARVANAWDFIEKKEGGLSFSIGDRGTKLSGGERQRLTIARAILKNPPILILDEATSSLDTESERLVQDAINHMMQNRTSIVIAHRLSTVRHADEIVVLDKGSIAERGTHDELMQTNGIYRKLVDMQEVK
jgi:subfamily B ATP-binding cassette protein MsbA